MGRTLNILLFVWLALVLSLIAHKAFAAGPLDKPPADKVVCVGFFDKHGELVAQICPAPNGPETVKYPIKRGQ